MTVFTYPSTARPFIGFTDCSGSAMQNLWCIFEHAITLPPVPIFVGFTRLSSLFAHREARRNSEWLKLTGAGNDCPIHTTIIALTDNELEARNTTTQYLASLPEWPRCNLRGYSLDRHARALRCSDGRIFPSQRHAAEALGVSQSAISRHMRGDLRTVKGVYISYLMEQTT